MSMEHAINQLKIEHYEKYRVLLNDDETYSLLTDLNAKFESVFLSSNIETFNNLNKITISPIDK